MLNNYLIYLYNHYLFIDLIIIPYFLQPLPSVKGLLVFYRSEDSNSTFRCKWLEGSNYFHQCITLENTSERIALYASTLILHKLQNYVPFTIGFWMSYIVLKMEKNWHGHGYKFLFKYCDVLCTVPYSFVTCSNYSNNKPKCYLSPEAEHQNRLIYVEKRLHDEFAP